jgi:hypothetical protein
MLYNLFLIFTHKDEKLSTLASVVTAERDTINPESYVKGGEFENYVRTYLFPGNEYELLNQSHDYETNNSDFSGASKEPDFKFKSIKTGKEFFVEAKYRWNHFNRNIDWCKPYQLKGYQEIDREVPVIIIIGLGQEPGDPDKIFVISLKKINWAKVYHSFSKEYEINKDQPVDISSII